MNALFVFDFYWSQIPDTYDARATITGHNTTGHNHRCDWRVPDFDLSPNDTVETREFMAGVARLQTSHNWLRNMRTFVVWRCGRCMTHNLWEVDVPRRLICAKCRHEVSFHTAIASTFTFAEDHRVVPIDDDRHASRIQAMEQWLKRV